MGTNVIKSLFSNGSRIYVDIMTGGNFSSFKVAQMDIINWLVHPVGREGVEKRRWIGGIVILAKLIWCKI